MGCYLGSQVFVTSDTTASIVCSGHKDVECTEFPNDQGPYTVYLLVTTSGTSAIGGGTVYYEYYDGNTWIQLDSYTMPGAYGPGYAYVFFKDIIPNAWTGQMRLRDDTDRCIKVWTQYSNTHKECVNGVCSKVAGRGADLCISNAGCVHNECVSGTCMSVPGIGVNLCIDNTGCVKHYNCDAQKNCVEDSHGVFITPNCDNLCNVVNPTKYNCISGVCQGPFQVGTYNSLNECLVSPGCRDALSYNCVNGSCQSVSGSGGQYSDYNSCIASGCQSSGGGNGGGDGGGVGCRSDQMNIFGYCLKTNDVYIVGGLFLGLLLLKKK